MLLLISPSKTQDFFPARNISGVELSPPPLLKRSAELVQQLRHYTADELAELMSVSDKLAQLNHQRFQDFTAPFTAKNAKPAIFAFRGDVYDGLDADSLSDDDLRFAQHSLRMLSGLYGVLHPFDLMQPYRLEMGTKLKNARGKDLYHYWGDTLTDLLNEELALQEKPVVVNLASQEYSSAISPKRIAGDWVNIHFKEEKNGQLKIIALFAKRARGSFARFVIRNRIESPEKLADFAEDGYRFQQELSTATDLVFARKAA